MTKYIDRYYLNGEEYGIKFESALRTTLPLTPTYDNYYFNLTFIPKEDTTQYAGYLIAHGKQKIYALDMYDNDSNWTEIGNVSVQSRGFDQRGIRICTGDNIIGRVGQISNIYGIYDLSGNSISYSTVTATSLPTNNYADFSYINTFNNVFVQKDGNTSGSDSSPAWKDYNWSTKTVNASGDLSNAGQTIFCADDPINPSFLWRGGGAYYTNKYDTIYKYDIANRTMTELTQTLPSTCACNSSFYYDKYAFFPLNPNYNEGTNSVYKFDTENLTGTTITLGTTLYGYETQYQFYLDKYLYIFPSGSNGIVIDMSTL